MANYNKSFNFRNGLQVDVDKFLITKTGLVGIGSTIPTKNLDVSGDVAVSGLTSSTNLGVSGNSEFYGDITIGSNIEIYSSTGDVHAQRYYGDGSFLGNIADLFLKCYFSYSLPLQSFLSYLALFSLRLQIGRLFRFYR